jgi:hypothetical protein
MNRPASGQSTPRSRAFVATWIRATERAGLVDVGVHGRPHNVAVIPDGDPRISRFDLRVAVLHAAIFADDRVLHAATNIDDLLGVVVVLLLHRPVLLEERKDLSKAFEGTEAYVTQVPHSTAGQCRSIKTMNSS